MSFVNIQNKFYVLVYLFVLSVCGRITGNDLYNNNLGPYETGKSKNTVTLYVTNNISNKRMDSLLRAVDYYEEALEIPNLFYIKLVEVVSNCENYSHKARSICIYEVPEDTDVKFGNANFSFNYRNHYFKGRIRVKILDLKKIHYDILYLHELGHIFGLEHTPELADNAMNPNTGDGKFHLHDWQVDEVRWNIVIDDNKSNISKNNLSTQKHTCDTPFHP